MSALSDLLNAANEAEYHPYRQIADIAREKGIKVSPGQVHTYFSGNHPTPSDRYLEAFAAVWPTILDIETLRAAARVAPDLGEYVPPPESRSLLREERDALDTIIKSLAKRHALEQPPVKPKRAPKRYQREEASELPRAADGREGRQRGK